MKDDTEVLEESGEIEVAISLQSRKVEFGKLGNPKDRATIVVRMLKEDLKTFKNLDDDSDIIEVIGMSEQTDD